MPVSRSKPRSGAVQISKAHALVDEGRAMLERRVPAALEARCEMILAAGGLGPPPPGALADEPLPLLAAAVRPGPRRDEGRTGVEGPLDVIAEERRNDGDRHVQSWPHACRGQWLPSLSVS
jgi:hypothetical protein